MEFLCYFKKVYLLCLVVLELKGMLLLMKVSDYLIWLVEVVLEYVVDVVFVNFVSWYGYFWCVDGLVCEIDFVIIGYGKLGGIELGYILDFDLVFVYSVDLELVIDGEKLIDNVVFYICFG